REFQLQVDTRLLKRQRADKNPNRHTRRSRPRSGNPGPPMDEVLALYPEVLHLEEAGVRDRRLEDLEPAHDPQRRGALQRADEARRSRFTDTAAGLRRRR